MVTIILEVAMWLVKYIVQLKMKKKLSDKEFVDFIISHQKRRSRAGKSATDFEDAMNEAMKEMENKRNEDKQN